VKRVQKVIGKNEGMDKFGLFCFLRDLREYFVVVNLTSNIPFLWNLSRPYGKSAVIMTSRFKDPNQCNRKVIIIVYNLPKRSGQVYDDWTMM